MFRSIVEGVARRFSRVKGLTPLESSPVAESVRKAPGFPGERARTEGVSEPEAANGLPNHSNPLAIAALPSPGERGFLSRVFDGSEGNGNAAWAIASTPEPTRVDAGCEAPGTPENVIIPGPTEDAVIEIDPVPERGRGVPDCEIQMRAYLKWEAAGKPKGHEARFWFEATQELHEGK